MRANGLNTATSAGAEIRLAMLGNACMATTIYLTVKVILIYRRKDKHFLNMQI
jgi:hypothetical protein